MCGIAGIVDLGWERDVDAPTLERMAQALVHRGPDEAGTLLWPGLGLASRRLSIVGLADGRQPLCNEDGTVAVVCNGELFDYPERRAELLARGHRFRTGSDSEILVHLWEERQVEMLGDLRGQFALALADRRRRQVLLARDQLGICPLYWTVRDGWLYFGSEIKALLASGAFPAELDPRALDHVFSFFAMGTRRTMFRGVEALLPGRRLLVGPGGVQEARYWDLDFPDRGHEVRGDEGRLADELGAHLERAVRLRLRADVPVVSYLSGGLDSTTVASLAVRSLGRPLPVFTIRIPHARLDETDRAFAAARSLGCEPDVLTCGDAEIAASYPELVVASEGPVIDTSSAAIYRLAARVRALGYKVALTGEGADEALAGYPWFKLARLTARLDRWPWRRLFFGIAAREQPWEVFRRRYEQLGGVHATSDLYGVCSLSGYHMLSRELRASLGGHTAADDLELDLERMRRWDPLNRSLYLGYKVMLAGLLMTHKGDRPSMANSVETRFPFLDLELVEFCARLAPEYKLRDGRRDKHLLRRLAARWLPPVISERPKSIFRARYSGSFLERGPAWVEQLLSPASLRRTGLFDPGAVRRSRGWVRALRHWPRPHMMHEMGLVGVISTQLWHHLFLGGGLCELPTWEPPGESLLQNAPRIS